MAPNSFERTAQSGPVSRLVGCGLKIVARAYQDVDYPKSGNPGDCAEDPIVHSGLPMQPVASLKNFLGLVFFVFRIKTRRVDSKDHFKSF